MCWQWMVDLAGLTGIGRIATRRWDRWQHGRTCLVRGPGVLGHLSGTSVSALQRTRVTFHVHALQGCRLNLPAGRSIHLPSLPLVARP